MLKKTVQSILAAVCISFYAVPSSSAKEDKIRYGVATTSFTYAPLYVAEDAGFFKKEGLDVKGVMMSGSGVEASATIAGDLPFYVGLPETAALAIAKGQKLANFAVVTKQYGIDIVVSKAVAQKLHLTRQTPIEKRLDALKGLRIAAWFPGSSTDMLIRFIVAKKGWNAQHDLTILPIGPAQPMLAALEHQRIDGFAISSPASDKAVQSAGAFILLRGAKGEWAPLNDTPFNCLIGNTSWLAAHKADAAGVYRGLALAMNFMREHPKAARAIIRKRLSTFDEAEFEAGYRNLHYLIPQSPAVGAKQANDIEDFMKTIDPSFSVPASRLVDPSVGALASRPVIEGGATPK